MILTAGGPVKYKSRDTRARSESRSVVVHHLGFWSRGPWFESGRDYQKRQGDDDEEVPISVQVVMFEANAA